MAAQTTGVFSGTQRAERTRSRRAIAARTAARIRLIEVLADAALVWLAFWLAWLARYRFEWGGDVRPWDWRPFDAFHGRAALFVGLTLAVLVIRGLYRLPRSASFLDEATMLIGGVTTAMAGVILTAFLARFVPSRLVFIYAWGIAIALLLARRLLWRGARHWLWARGIGVDHVLVVGAGDAGRRLMQAMMGQPALGYRVIGYVADGDASDMMAVATEGGVTRAERLGTTADLRNLIGRMEVDEVIVALPADAHGRVVAIVEECRQSGVTFKVVPDLLQLSLDRVDLAEVAGVPLIGIKDASIRGLNYVVKRSIDILIATSVLLVMAIPMLVIAILIRRDSPGPILFRQVRIGRDGRPFVMLKFRCMIDGADEQRAELIRTHHGVDPRLFKLRDDPRLTRVGRWLRRWSLDELPQFINVLRGQMSVVGPRPPLPEEVERYEEWHRQRLLVTPGLTGLWQINGRSNLTFDEMVRLDLYYAEHWSPWLDVKIVLRTIPAVLTGRGAY
jgi:exopolysaccharide biosynthesis polyprenyl glycosylphosphotransferase